MYAPLQVDPISYGHVMCPRNVAAVMNSTCCSY